MHFLFSTKQATLMRGLPTFPLSEIIVSDFVLKPSTTLSCATEFGSYVLFVELLQSHD